MQKYYVFEDSPVGELWIAMREGFLTDLRFVRRGDRASFAREGIESGEELGEATRQLRAYFRGELTSFDLPVRFETGTVFQRKAWRELGRIPYGQTITYGEQARRMGNPRACRAVGGANRANPVAIVVPCHRVIGSDGKLTGFGGGLGTKEKLLRLEKVEGIRR
ncbi:MAG TPA: methylated-DNA--[protein]-cysteine S-methyltransferase [Candidatus Krumholzibacterium sp.]|nr:methylated-DNA--[protein]-cysteine S-methyltransferase [Candidatus Krumholzibacterium sp.]